MNSFIKKYVGDRAFYKMVLSVAVPVMIQNGITNLVNMLDNIMVGTLGTEQMSGVSIVNQFVFIFNLLIFGAVSAGGIFTSQYHGSGDTKGVRYSFRYKLYAVVISAVIGILCFTLFDEALINLFLHESENTGDLEKTLLFGKEYLKIILIGLLPYSITQAYASTIRETGETVMPMVASTVAVATNFVLNLLLIFGLFGFPALGVAGAAIATTVSRFAELLILVVFAHKRTHRFTYLKGFYKSLYIPSALVRKITLKGLPIMLNELLWAVAMMLRNQSYSVRGLDVVAAGNISSTLFNVFNVVYLALGSSVAIIVGAMLGAGDFDKARDTVRKMLAFTVFISAALAVIFALTGLVFPKIYNTTPEVQGMASYMMLILALIMPFCAYANAAYFTLRSGGRVMITILFDSVYMWCIVVPICVVLAYFTELNIYIIYAISQFTEIIKVIFGIILIKRGTWVIRLVSEDEKAPSDTEKAPCQTKG